MEKYRVYFQQLIDILREDYKFTNAKKGQSQSWYSFSSGFSGIVYGMSFGLGNKARVELYIDLNDHDKIHIACAGLLHDIGHGPFSHTFESLIRESLNVDHVDLTLSLLYGEHGIFEIDEEEFLDIPCVFDILLKYDIDAKLIGNIIKGKNCIKNYLCQLLNNSIDIDQLFCK